MAGGAGIADVALYQNKLEIHSGNFFRVKPAQVAPMTTIILGSPRFAHQSITFFHSDVAAPMIWSTS
jgi:hypothetical protein